MFKNLEMLNETEFDHVLEDIDKLSLHQQKIFFNSLSEELKSRVDARLVKQWNECIDSIIDIMKKGGYENL